MGSFFTTLNATRNISGTYQTMDTFTNTQLYTSNLYGMRTSTYTKACTMDSDCYAASDTPSFSAATTDADKAKRCCMYLGLE